MTDLQLCGHPKACIVYTNEKTHYCGWCESLAQQTAESERRFQEELAQCKKMELAIRAGRDWMLTSAKVEYRIAQEENRPWRNQRGNIYTECASILESVFSTPSEPLGYCECETPWLPIGGECCERCRKLILAPTN